MYFKSKNKKQNLTMSKHWFFFNRNWSWTRNCVLSCNHKLIHAWFLFPSCWRTIHWYVRVIGVNDCRRFLCALSALSRQNCFQNHTLLLRCTRPTLLALGRDLYYPQNFWKRLPGVQRLVLVCARRTVNTRSDAYLTSHFWPEIDTFVVHTDFHTLYDVIGCVPSTGGIRPEQTWS